MPAIQGRSSLAPRLHRKPRDTTAEMADLIHELDNAPGHSHRRYRVRRGPHGDRSSNQDDSSLGSTFECDSDANCGNVLPGSRRISRSTKKHRLRQRSDFPMSQCLGMSMSKNHMDIKMRKSFPIPPRQAERTNLDQRKQILRLISASRPEKDWIPRRRSRRTEINRL